MRRTINRQKSNLRIVAIVCADVHLSHTAPIARSAEPDWYVAMERPLTEIKELMVSLGCKDCICAGDLFDRWDSPPELINWAMCTLPKKFISIPGQHDLPLHQSDDLWKSAFKTLDLSGAIDHLSKGFLKPSLGCLCVDGFGWKEKLQKFKQSTIGIAIVHKYIWTDDVKRGGKLRNSEHVVRIAKQLQGYTTAFFGDNHSPFDYTDDKITIVNCGSLMARTTAQRNYKPAVYVLYEDGTYAPHFLDISQDKWTDEKIVQKEIEAVSGLKELTEDYRKLSQQHLSFLDALQEVLKDPKVSEDAKGVILATIERVK